MSQKKIYTTEYYARRKINFHTPYGLGFTRLVIFTDSGEEIYERNNKTGYCKDWLTNKRISQAKWNEMYKRSVYAF